MFALTGQCKLTKVEFKYLGQVTCILPCNWDQNWNQAIEKKFLGSYQAKPIVSRSTYLTPCWGEQGERSLAGNYKICLDPRDIKLSFLVDHTLRTISANKRIPDFNFNHRHFYNLHWWRVMHPQKTRGQNIVMCIVAFQDMAMKCTRIISWTQWYCCRKFGPSWGL